MDSAQRLGSHQVPGVLAEVDALAIPKEHRVEAVLRDARGDLRRAFPREDGQARPELGTPDRSDEAERVGHARGSESEHTTDTPQTHVLCKGGRFVLIALRARGKAPARRPPAAYGHTRCVMPAAPSGPLMVGG